MKWAIAILVAAAALAGVVRWAQPKMAFFPWPGVQETPASAGLDFTDLKIATKDGETLHGWWMPHPSPRATVVYWHGNGGNLSLWLTVLVDIQRRGFNVVAVDYRGYGASTGSASEKGLYRDADAVGQYVAAHFSRPGVRTVYWGRSLGCAVASYAASRTPPDAVILESPFPNVRALFARNPVMLTLSVFSTYRFDTAAHLQTYTGPLLVVHGDADSIIPFSAGRQVFDRAKSQPKTFAVLEGADHNDLHAGHPAYWRAVDAFLASLR